ncbi:fatty alcohol:caffeoyl-CoA acyltransferase-like [Papaver somniferum]|uniref:fatty alcohol:caffeoyl-CoA acyltransferase-like n=1 Tax=Papaver somniferum TaxID=3469 RepID=UPI000E6F5347|nr:fatty alcohol:caffeoyl-CoA acyltransferase-like [Papaver somniferum]
MTELCEYQEEYNAIEDKQRDMESYPMAVANVKERNASLLPRTTNVVGSTSQGSHGKDVKEDKQKQVAMSSRDQEMCEREYLERQCNNSAGNNKIPRKSVPIEDLKSSLSEVLFHYYPLVGRIRICSEDEDRLEVDCNGKGALLAEGFMDFTVDEFLKDNTWLNMAWKDKLLFEVDAQSDLDIPPLVIQVTYLSCGGMLMCISMYHCMADGVGVSKFLHDWAHLRGNPNMDLPIPPIHNRELLKPRNPLQIPFDHPEFTDITQDFDISKYLKSQTLDPSCLTMTQSHIQRLKTFCEPSLKCSTFEALAAHVWRCYVKALNLPSSLIVKWGT